MSPVYPPSEDSFLLLDAVSNRKFKVMVDVGSGSGVICVEVAKRGLRAICSDIDFEAAAASRRRALREGVYPFIDVVVGDLARHLRLDRVDLIAFNPPYLPPDEYSTDLDRATVRSPKNDAIGNFLRMVSGGPRGIVALLVVSSLTPLDEVIRMSANLGIKTRIVARLKLFYEELYVVELTH